MVGGEGAAYTKQEMLETLPSCRGFSPQLSLIKFSEHFPVPARCGAWCQGPAAGIQQGGRVPRSLSAGGGGKHGLLCFRAQ